MENHSGKIRLPAWSSRKLARRYKRAAGDRTQQVTDQRTRDFRREQHRIFAGGQRTRRHPRQGPFRRLPADGDRRLQVVARKRAAVPAVALHVLALPGDQRATQRVLGAAVAAEEAMRIGVHGNAFPAAHRGAIGVGDARIELAARRFAGQGQVDRMVRIQRPRMPGVEIGEIGGHQRGIGEAGGFVVLGVTRDRAGLFHRGLQAFLAQVGGAGAALALAEVHGDADAAVAGGFHGFHRAHAHVDVEAAVLAAADLGLVGAERAGAIQQASGKIRQRLQADQAVVGGKIGDCVQWLIL